MSDDFFDLDTASVARGDGVRDVTLTDRWNTPLGTPNGGYIPATMLREPQTIHIYRQDKDDDIRDCADMYDLDEGIAALLGGLAQGSHLLKVGSAALIHVEHVRSKIERELTNTDSAMLGTVKAA